MTQLNELRRVKSNLLPFLGAGERNAARKGRRETLGTRLGQEL